MPDDTEARLARLEAWMSSQHWPGDPVRITPPDFGPDSDLHPDDAQKKAELAARDRALIETRTPAEDAALKARIEKLEARLNNLHGQGGIRVTGSVIELISRQAKTGEGSDNPLEVQDEGSVITNAASTLDFTGSGVTASASGGIVTITIPGGISADTTNPTNSGSGAAVLKTGTNVIGRTLKSSDDSILIEEGTDEIDFTLPEDTTMTEATYVIVQVQIGGTLEAHEVTLRGVDLGQYTEA